MKQMLLTDREFAALAVPASREQMEALEESLMEEGCLKPILLWRGYILDGYKRYEICRYEEIEFVTEETDFRSKQEAIGWICRQRLSGISRSTNLFRYLVGKLYGSQKELLYEQRKAEGKLNQAYNTLEKVDFPWHRVSIPIAEEVGINRTTVEKHGAFSLALDKIGEMEPSLFRAILAGTANFTRKEIFEMAQITSLR